MYFGIIGTGNMAHAFIKGILDAGVVSKDMILCNNKNHAKAVSFAEEYGITAVEDSITLVGKCDFVFLAVKPNMLRGVITKNAMIIQEKQPCIVSFAAAKSIDYLEECLGFINPIIRVMPNLNAKISMSVTALCGNSVVTDAQRLIITELCQTIGAVYEIPESSFSSFSALCGSSIALTYTYIDALTKAGIKAGINKQMAREFAALTVLGSAKLVSVSSEHPESLVYEVCSPGGTTIEGICHAHRLGFEGIVIECIDKIIEKDKQLSIEN